MTSESRSRLTSCFGTHTRILTGMQVCSEDDLFALRARFEQMNDIELAAFSTDPANRVLLRRYDSFAVRQVLPDAAVFSLLCMVSLIVAGALRF